ncbi:hypothetical protein SERLA73DRAFT_119383 [Serpula lacrymans var. lacrymans S7.3]|uniref:DNA mismatch repair protein n=2 Tax=Serpula lacrymans var. lacrymans TaxID=341189 RepID=F8PJB0_SERL3|nr:uncharacterized protein SERLADRAFT_365596 [Serpula lacrymans var. lacrymans S7.9]EGO03735.1 hypothetical protein SERLA73DRAFT_119383 [Serpula lacrymans var. lacrymans S7.3]EGO29601.1 hypothetical protein SERLADRAFT_365596 [Serpula lacrymans var. lacrymans S7.9]
MAPQTQKTPAKQRSNENMKQKSLFSWLGKSAPSEGKATSHVNVPNRSISQATRTPESKASSAKMILASSAVTSSRSSHGSSIHETPPTSDPIDVDMLSEDEEEVEPKPTRKRKVIIDDSEDEEETKIAATKKVAKSTYRTSSPDINKSSSSRSRAKKPRICVMPSDDEDGDEELSSFSSRLLKYKKSPIKSRKSQSSSVADDDDFIVPSDEDEVPERSSSRASARSVTSRRSSKSASSEVDTELEDEEDGSKKTKAKRPQLKNNTGGSSAGGSNLFLTAAEQRAQEKKTEKKSAEDPFSFLVDVRDKDGVKPGEPGYDPRTLYIPKKAWADFTPFEKQLYEDDARVGHTEFDLKLTQRVKMSMVGVPEMSFNFWAAKFLGKGYKVGRVDQAETALGAEMRMAADKTKGKPSADKGKEKIHIRRELNKVYTNGTLVDEDLLTDEQAGHCISIREDTSDVKKGSSFGLCVLDSATSQFDLSAFDDDVCMTKLETMMRQLRPEEVIFTKGNLSVPTSRLLKAILPAACLWTSLRDVEGFPYDQTIKELNNMFAGDEDEDVDGEEALNSAVPEGIKDMAGCRDAIEALGATLWYLRQLNIDKDLFSMKNFNVYDPLKKGQNLVLDGQTLAHIEVFVNDEGTDEGTLHKLLGRCITPFGKRLFRIWLCVPLRNVTDINARLDAVEALMDHETFEETFTDLAKGLPDLERIVSRIHAKNCKIKDFMKVLAAFRKLNMGLGKLTDSSETFESKTITSLLRSAPDLTPHIKNVESRFIVDKDTDNLLPVEGKDDVYDEVMAEITELEETLDSQLRKFEKKLGITLTWWHSAQGNKEIYLVQTKVGQKNIPDDWTKSGGTKAAARWLVPSLQSTIRKLKEARENRNTAIKEFKNRLYAEFDADRGVWLRAVRVLAELDCLFSLAKSSRALGEPLCRPEFVEGDAAWIDFKELRHPALSGLREDFIPNDVRLGGEMSRVALLTVAMRMTATGVIMAQLGMFVPAKSARLCPVDTILTRMGAYDNMFSNASTFKVELDECCKILRDATPKSFVILDELGRGTSTYDGMAIAGAVLHQLATHTLPLAFFATHYGTLTSDFAYHPNVRNMHMATLLDDEKCELVFLYKLVEGIAESSFGTHVASLAGVPTEVVKRAEVVSEDFAKKFKARLEGKQKASASLRLPHVVQADFVYLLNLASGKERIPDDAFMQRQLLKGLKDSVSRCVSS